LGRKKKVLASKADCPEKWRAVGGVPVAQRLKLMGKKESTRKKEAIKLRDLPPKKDPQGGGLGFMRSPALPIPPPGFFASSPKPESSNGHH